jgi:N-methylhydantoinase B
MIMARGGQGTLNCIEVRRGEETPHRIRKTVACKLQKNDVVRIRSGAGGGWGEPLDREPARILKGVKAGLLSPQEAESVYGVAIEPEKSASGTSAP